jgi:hypothetical protein
MAGRLQDVILRDTRANQPLATAVSPGTLYFVTGENVLERSNGTSWESYSGAASGGLAGNVPLFGLDGLDGEDGFPGFPGPSGPAGSAASAAWSLIEARAASGTEEDFINLSAYSELLIMCHQVTGTLACIRQVLVSTDNGGTFLNTSGNYVDIDGNGVETNGTVLSLHNTSNASARSCWGILSGFNLGTSLKFWQAGFPTTNLVSYVNTLTALNAIRVRPHTGSFNGGTIYILGR